LLIVCCVTSLAQMIDIGLLKDFGEKLQKEGDKVELDLKYWTCCFGDDCNKNELVWNTLVEYLKSKNAVHIEVASHTDCRGNTKHNEVLSKSRSEAFLKILVRKGISKKRITTVGYGETNLKITCKCEACTDKDHEQNRRTQIRITKI